ncbi:hypothetical protein PLICRDRAFT_174277 [Plicaturopsis crispa FD-325 SS-3]|nr:hypothetical protein PLICRDRAFT_174277 [Plicaturopsis crispa FD-325 SS-3]
MHPCLRIIDILDVIFFYVQRPDGGSRDLGRLATVCKAFEDPALDLLWHTQDSLKPLLKTLGPDIWEEWYEDEADEGTMSLSGATISSDAWKRLKTYADRVRTLVLQGMSVIQPFDEESLQTLLGIPEVFPLMSHLRTLEVGHNRHTSATSFSIHPLSSFILLFMGPSLKRLSFEFAMDSMLLHAMADRCPGLSELMIPFCRIDGPSSTAIRRGWLTLTHLYCGCITFDGLIAISTLPSLRHLDLEFDFEWPETARYSHLLSSFAETNTPVLQFQSLTSIDVVLEQIADLSQLVDFASMEYLGDICINTITEDSNGSGAEWAAFFEVLGRRCSHAAPSRINIEVWEGSDIGAPAPPQDQCTILNFRALRPLLSFHGLRVFRCDVVYGYDIEDADLERMAISWPLLNEFALAPAYGWVIPSRITLLGLAALARHCPTLSALGLVVDLLDVETVLSPPWDIVPNTSLVSLCLGNSPVSSNTLAVAVSLSRLMPNVAELWAWGDVRQEGDMHLRSNVSEEGMREFDRRWKEILSYIKGGVFQQLSPHGAAA